jgi:hypothetical protein
LRSNELPVQIVHRSQRFHIDQQVIDPQVLYHGYNLPQPGQSMLMCQLYDARGHGQYQLMFTPEFLLAIADLINRVCGREPQALRVEIVQPPAVPRRKRKAEKEQENEKDAIKRRMLEGR